MLGDVSGGVSQISLRRYSQSFRLLLKSIIECKETIFINRAFVCVCLHKNKEIIRKGKVFKDFFFVFVAICFTAFRPV